MRKKLYLIFNDFLRQVQNDNINVYAASIAFFTFLSIIPMLLLICSMLPLTPITETDFLQVLLNMMPESIDPFVSTLVSEVYSKSFGTISITAIFTVWSAAKGVMALIRGLNAVNGVKDKKGYLRLCLRAIFFTIVFLIAIMLSLFILVFGRVIMNLVTSNLPQINTIVNAILDLRFLFVWIILTIIFVLMYVFIPNKKQKFVYQIPGAIFSSISWSLFSWGFSLYINSYDAYNMYGSLATIIIIMLWLYTSLYFLLIGANMNRYFKPMMRYFFKKRFQKEDFS